MESFLFHGIKWRDYDLLVNIIESGYILPRCMIDYDFSNDKNNIFNGTKYISLSDKGLVNQGAIDIYWCAYDEFIVDQPSLVLKKDNLKIIHPKIITRHQRDLLSNEEWRAMLYDDDSEERLTYYMDEVQVKEPISIRDNLVAVGIPSDYLNYVLKKDEANELIDRVNSAVKKNGIDVPIVDSCMYSFADNERNIEKHKIKSRF